MAATQQRMPLWAAEAEIDEDMHDVDVNLAIGNYGQNLYDQGAPFCPPRPARTLTTGARQARRSR
jgi:hypothetical protein